MIESVEKFGKYRLVERLAAGGMAEIFRATVRDRDGRERVVAIKRLHRQFSEDNEFVTMLSDEARLAVQLKHRNIGEVFDLGCIDGQYFIVMEFIDGLDLHELTNLARSQNRRVPLEAIVYVVSRVAGALHYAHTKRGRDGRSLEVVHRDVSPQNMMVSIDGAVKLVDFGIAKARMRAQHTRAGIIKGKFYYMSPEQAHGNRIDARTDVYALGMVLYEVLTGEHPFERVPDAELLRAVRTADYLPIRQILPDLPQTLVSIVDRALARRADLRYQSARELEYDLNRFAKRELPAFGPRELATWVRKYTDKHLPEKTRAADFEAMDSDLYSASEHSVIFEAGANAGGEPDDFEEDETQVFVRAGADDYEAEHTEMLSWDGEGGDSDEPVGQARAVSGGERDFSDELRDEVQRAAMKAEEPPLSSAPPLISPPDEGVDPYGRRQTEQIHRRLLTAVFQRVDHLFRRRPHLVGGVLAALAVVILGLSAWLVWGPDGEEEEDWHVSIAQNEGELEPAEVAVELSVSTQPANARIYLDGQFAGYTPELLPGLEVGDSYVLRFERDGYDPKELDILAESEMTPLVVRLEPLGGILRVESEPEGAQIFVDGELEGEAPVTIMGLDREMIHRVEARFGDQEEQSQDVEWDRDDDRIRELAFEFEVQEQPAPTRRARRSSRRSSSGTASAPRRPRGSQGSEITAPGSADQSSGEESGGSIDIWGIAAEEQQGRLNVRVDAGEGHIYVNGKLVKDDTVLVGHSLDAGRHTVRVYYPSLDRHSETRTVQVRPGETSTVRFSP